MKKYRVALLLLLAAAAAMTVACGSSSVPTFSKMSMMSEVSPAGALYTMNLDGSDATAVQTGATSQIWGLSVSADFKTATYASNGGVWSINPTSGTPTQLAQTNAGSSLIYVGVRISPNGQKILYPVFDSNSNATLWIMNADGTGSLNLNSTLPSGMSSCNVGSFSADSSKITFACEGNSFSTFGLYTIHTDGTQLATVLTQSSEIDNPSFTPNGSQILFITWGTLGSNAVERSLNHAGHFRSLTMKPDVVSVSSQGVASVNLDGSNATMLVSGTTDYIYEAEILNSNLYYVTSVSSSSSQPVYQIFEASLSGTGSTDISSSTASNILGICGYCGE